MRDLAYTNQEVADSTVRETGKYMAQSLFDFGLHALLGDVPALLPLPPALHAGNHAA
jgi:hypothetical protein